MKIEKYMKLRTTALSLLLSASSLASCMRDAVPSDGRDDGLPVVISFSPTASGASTRGYHDPDELLPGDGADASDADGRAKDTEITHIALLLYRSSTGAFVTRVEQTVPPDADRIEIEALTGTYDIVIIANGDANGATPGDRFEEDFFATPANYNVTGKIRNALLTGEAFDQTASIPMFAIERGVEIVGDHHVRAGGLDYDDTLWSPALTRVGIRLSIELTLTLSQFDDWESGGEGTIEISNTAAAAWLQEAGKPNDDPRATARTYTARAAAWVADPEIPADPKPVPASGADGYWWLEEGAGAGGADVYIVRFDRIVLPELILPAVAGPEEAMKLALTLGGSTVSAAIGCHSSANLGYSVPRNTWLHLDATVANARLLVVPEVIPWNTVIGGGVMVDKYRIGAPEYVYIAGVVPGGFEATSNVAGIGLLTEDGSYKIEYPHGNGSGWLDVSLRVHPAETSAPDSDGGTLYSRRLEVQALSENDTHRMRGAWIWVVAGESGLSKGVFVIQTPRGVHAAPGVIGYIAGGPRFGELTLRGSSAFAGTPLEAEAALMFPDEGGLHSETVYTALFKWGSLTALSSDVGDPEFGIEDIIAAPADYNGIGYPHPALEAMRGLVGTDRGPDPWKRIPQRGFRSGMNGLDGWKMEPDKGLGEPCTYYFGDGWRMPDGGPEGWNGGLDPGLPLPAAGYRHMDTGAHGGNTLYWSATPLTATAGYGIIAGIDELEPTPGTINYEYAIGVRCFSSEK